MWKSIAFATCLAWYSLSGVAVNLPAQDSVPEFRKNTENTFTVTGRVVNNATGQGFAGGARQCGKYPYHSHVRRKR